MARIIYIHTLVQGREKMWRFVRILCIWNQYANMLFMLRVYHLQGIKKRERLYYIMGKSYFDFIIMAVAILWKGGGLIIV